MKKIIIPFALVATLIFVGCKDDDQNTEVIKTPKTISSVYGAVNLSYNASGQLIKVTDKDSDDEYTETVFTYDSSGKVTKFVTIYHEDNDVETYSYNITYPSANQARVIDESNDYIIVNFDAKGQAISFNDFGDLTNFTYDDRGNIVKITDNVSTVTASYNNDKGILSGINSPKWILLLTDMDLFYYAANNPVSINSVYQNGEQIYTDSETYTYPSEHIIDGYPTRMSVDYNNGSSSYNELYTISY